MLKDGLPLPTTQRFLFQHYSPVSLLSQLMPAISSVLSPSLAVFLHLLFKNKIIFNDCGSIVFLSHLCIISIFLVQLLLMYLMSLGEAI